MPDDFDVFLSHNNRDKPLVEEIGERLRARGLCVWLADWEMQPGVPWQGRLENVVQTARAVAVFVGEAGLGPWQELETRASLNRTTEEALSVIPVLLPGGPAPKGLPLFLKTLTCVDLRKGLTEEGMKRLVWGITGERPAGMSGATPGTAAMGVSRNMPALGTWIVGLSVLGVLLPGGWHLLRSLAKPDLYSVRVHVLDPQGQPVTGSIIRTGPGNEPHLLSDGWWEVQIPAAKAPTDGRISLWAEHPDWTGNWGSLRLQTDPNPQVEIRLKPPESWIRGRVEVEGKDEALSGARVTRQDGGPGEAITDADGRFALKLALPREKRIRLRSEYKDWKPGDDFCYTGRDRCSIFLEK